MTLHLARKLFATDIKGQVFLESTQQITPSHDCSNNGWYFNEPIDSVPLERIHSRGPEEDV